MTNNKLCDIIGGAGCAITALSMGLIFFGVPCWFGAVLGIAIALISQVNYD